MRQLYILRGLPGSGKSTWVKTNGLEAYTISPDQTRLEQAAPVLTLDGFLGIEQSNRMTWDRVYELLFARMERGELIVVDATHTQENSLNYYTSLARKFHYRLFLVDFDYPLELCLQNNERRCFIRSESHKFVPEDVVRNMHKNLYTDHLRTKRWSPPSAFHVVTVSATSNYKLEFMNPERVNLGDYTMVHHIGDIRGCFTPLKKYFEHFPIRDDHFYIFTGDLLDRGRENGEVVEFILSIAKRKNVAFVEGNHDSYIRPWVKCHAAPSVETERTWEEVETKLLGSYMSKNDARGWKQSELNADLSALMLKMRECFHYTFENREVLVTHGGLSQFPTNLALVSSKQLIRGVGKYAEMKQVADSFARTTNSNQYQVFGHRNPDHLPTEVAPRSFCLEGKVEYGGALRVLQLSNEGFDVIEIQNPKDFPTYPDNNGLAQSLRMNPGIIEKAISPTLTNFSTVPYPKDWTPQRVNNRSIFINPVSSQIVIRSYPKYFNVGEKRELPNLREEMVFPMNIWYKENGYLGLVGYDQMTEELVFASKTTTEGNYARWFQQQFWRHFRSFEEYITSYLKEHNRTLAFKVILPEEDPHIIQHASKELILLDIINNTQEVSFVDYEDFQSFADAIRAHRKQLYETVQSYHELEIELDTFAAGTHVEGLMIEYKPNKYVKWETDYYKFWKLVRTFIHSGRPINPQHVPKSHEHLLPDVESFASKFTAEQLKSMSVIEFRNRLQED